jgi:hypothetical protein
MAAAAPADAAALRSLAAAIEERLEDAAADIAALGGAHSASAGGAFAPAVVGGAHAGESLKSVAAMLREALVLVEHPQVRETGAAV